MSAQVATSAPDDLAAHRSRTVTEHKRLGLANDLEGLFATFATPRYEVYGQGAIYDGRDEVVPFWRLAKGVG